MKEIYDELTRLRDEQYAKSIEGIKKCIIENGEKTNPFVDNISLDISGDEIEYSYDCTFDKIYYIPSKDELGFIIFDHYDSNKIFLIREFKRGDVSDVYTIFVNLYYTYGKTVNEVTDNKKSELI